MKKKYISTLICLTFLGSINIVNAAINVGERNGDSVMTPGTMVKPALTSMKKNQGTSTNYTPNQEIEYSSASCPAGYSNGGNSVFHTGQRLITKFYSNGQLMKTTTGDWLSTNESCTGTEDQTVSCPSGYTGSVKQRRTVTYNTSGYNYGNWSDTSNSCVVIPPPPPVVAPPPPPALCPVIYSMGLLNTVKVKWADGYIAPNASPDGRSIASIVYDNWMTGNAFYNADGTPLDLNLQENWSKQPYSKTGVIQLTFYMGNRNTGLTSLDVGGVNFNFSDAVVTNGGSYGAEKTWTWKTDACFMPPMEQNLNYGVAYPIKINGKQYPYWNFTCTSGVTDKTGYTPSSCSDLTID